MLRQIGKYEFSTYTVMYDNNICHNNCIVILTTKVDLHLIHFTYIFTSDN